MVLAGARLRGIPGNIQNGGRPGGNDVSILMMNHGVAAVTRVDLLCVFIL